MPTKILIIDHNDSFTFNLVHLFEQMEHVEIFVRPVANLLHSDGEEADAVVLSPGPGLPGDYPVIKDFLQRYITAKPLLGVCLGLQHIVTYFGGTLYRQAVVIHGRQIALKTEKDHFLFAGVARPVQVGLYHSWAADKASLPACLKITSTSMDGTIMSLQHIALPVTAVQFHPESYMTVQGKQLVSNWLGSIRK